MLNPTRNAHPAAVPAIAGRVRRIRIMRAAARLALAAALIAGLLLPTAAPVSAQSCEGADCAPEFTGPPRTLSYTYVSSSVEEGQATFAWTTGYEVANIGFNIVVDAGGELVTVNDSLIPAGEGAGVEPQNYSYSAAVDADAFYIESIDVEGEAHRAGPYAMNAAVGAPTVADGSDWDAIHAELDAMEAERNRIDAAAVNAALDAVRGPAPSPDAPLIEQSAGTIGEHNVYLPFLSAGQGQAEADVSAAASENLAPGAKIDLLVEEDGIYRVTHSDLVAAGFDLTGVTPEYLALTNQGSPVRMRVVAPAGSWGQVNGGDPYIEFVGTALDTLYTGTNVYVLQVDRTKAFRTFRDLRLPDPAETLASHYTESFTLAEQSIYRNSSPTDDPWVMKRLFASGTTPDSVEYQVPDLNSPANVSGGSVSASFLRGIGYDHHVTVELNGQLVIDDWFPGSQLLSNPSEALPANAIQQSGNVIKVTLPMDTGDPHDIVYIDSVEIDYPRKFVAQDNALDFAHDGARFQVDGFTGGSAPTVIVYSEYRNRLWRIENVQVAASSNGYAATFGGWSADADYVVAVENDLHTPQIRAGSSATNLVTNTQVDMVIISHPNFINGLAPLVAAREAEGLTVSVVDVNDVYAAYSHSIFDAQAIRDYLAEAMATQGVQYVLLVGGDTYDYRDFTNSGSESFVPSLYTETHPNVKYGAVDPLFVEVLADGIPDIAIGRFPVRTTSELSDVVSKTLKVADYDYGRKAIFAADEFDGVSYTSLSESFIDAAPALNAWDSITRVYLDDYLGDNDPNTTVETARTDLISAFNAGSLFVSYLGHSAPTRWTFLGLLSGTDVTGLANPDKPSIVVQWGCWNTYYVSPTSDGMAHQFLLSGNRGAAAVFGSTGLTYVSSDVYLSQILTPKLLEPGARIGDALRDAKFELGGSTNRPDVLYGWTLMGDPTVIVEPAVP